MTAIRGEMTVAMDVPIVSANAEQPPGKPQVAPLQALQCQKCGDNHPGAGEDAQPNHAGAQALPHPGGQRKAHQQPQGIQNYQPRRDERTLVKNEQPPGVGDAYLKEHEHGK
jgi:hypothetical protein